jgi:hypothetical protein
MNEETKDMLKEAYQYGYAHGCEDVANHLLAAIEKHPNKDQGDVEIDKNMLTSMMDVVFKFAENTKQRELSSYN